MTKPRLIICLMGNICNVTGLNTNCMLAVRLGSECETVCRMFCILVCKQNISRRSRKFSLVNQHSYMAYCCSRTMSNNKNCIYFMLQSNFSVTGSQKSICRAAHTQAQSWLRKALRTGAGTNPFTGWLRHSSSSLELSAARPSSPAALSPAQTSISTAIGRAVGATTH